MEGIFRRRRLPHWDVADATYFVTSCLAGSLPAHGLSALRGYRTELDARVRPSDLTEDEWGITKHKLLFARFDWLIDRESQVRWLEQPKAACSVRKSMYHFADHRYQLLAYVVMPSHVHWVFRPLPKWCDEIAADPKDARTPRERILHSFKSFTGNECNQLLGRSGQFWQDESYEHCVRNADELLRIIEYIEQNPVKAGLIDVAAKWPYSSAADRAQLTIPMGDPLLVGQVSSLP
jgi:REP element-mobilizing transposase RayT